jgi:hypothetical protein
VRRIAPYVAILTVLALTPALGEIVENAAHWVASGHAAHDVDDADHAPVGDEHGCSGTMHLCSCHATPLAVAPVAVSLPTRPPRPGQQVGVGPRVEIPDGHIGRIFRPPIA